MGHTYNTSITVDWPSLLFVLERRYQASVRYYNENLALLKVVLTSDDQNAYSRQSRALLLDCNNVVELAGLANSVRLFIGLYAQHYDLKDVRAVRSELRKYFEEV